MKTKDLIGPVAVTVCSLFAVGCVMTGTHEAAIAAERDKQVALQKKLDSTGKQLSNVKTERDGLTETKAALEGEVGELDNKLTRAMTQNQALVDEVSSMGKNVESLLGEKDTLSAEREKLNKEVAELRRMREAAEARNKEYKSLLGKLAKMIDAGSLDVSIRKGRMIVSMPSDVLFPAGRANLKPQAKEALEELAVSIASFPERKFQVIGHSDATPIRTARFPSNWELSSQRAIEVVKVLTEAGVPAEMLSAAGSAEYDPVAPNDTADNQALNRRVELVFVPKIDELPGFDQILKN